MSLTSSGRSARPSSPVESDLARLERRLGLPAVLDPLQERARDLDPAETRLARLRARGWRWYEGLEAERRELKRLSATVLQQAHREREAAVAPLVARLDAARRRVERADSAALAPLREELDLLDEALVAAERRVEVAVLSWLRRVEGLLDRLWTGEDTLSGFSDAGFALRSDERPLLAVRATWLEPAPPPDEPSEPPGRLLLTDARVRFERRDDRILRKNRMGLAVERRDDRTLLFDEPASALAFARDASVGWLSKQPRIKLGWKDGAFSGRVVTLALERGAVEELSATAMALARGDLAPFR